VTSLVPLLINTCNMIFSSVYRNRIIVTAHLMRDLYYKRNPPARGSSSNISVKSYFEALAMDEHASSVSSGPADAYQWIGHPMRATLCRMKGGSILTGVGDKVGVASYNFLDMFNQHKYQI